MNQKAGQFFQKNNCQMVQLFGPKVVEIGRWNRNREEANQTINNESLASNAAYSYEQSGK